jgi:hypothetical protein
MHCRTTRCSTFCQNNLSVLLQLPPLSLGRPSRLLVCGLSSYDLSLTRVVVPGDVETEEHLRPLTSLSWPYVPEESAYTDPLKRDDPKVVQLPQYEAIGNSSPFISDIHRYDPWNSSATSAAVRKALSEHPDLKPLLRSIDSLRGREREATIQRALGVSHAEHQGDLSVGEQDVEAMRRLSSAIEAAIRGDTPSSLGLDLDGERS